MHNFDVKKVKNEITEWILNWFKKNGKGCRIYYNVWHFKKSSFI